MQETNTYEEMHQTKKDSSKKKLRKDWERHFYCDRQDDPSLIILTSCICHPTITFDLLTTYNWLMVININQWPVGTDILDLSDLPKNLHFIEKYSYIK